MDQRLVIPKNLQENVMLREVCRVCRCAMLREASDVWWPRIHREKEGKPKNCAEC